MSRYGRKVKIFSALEVANICGVVNQTAINWIKNGHLKAFTTPGGQYRVYAKDLAAFLDTRGMADSGEALQVFLEKADRSILLFAVENQALGNQIREDLKSILPEHEVLLAFDGFDAGRIITESKPGFIILDRNLPGIDCNRLIRTVKENINYGKPFIFVLQQGQEPAPAHCDGTFNLPAEIQRFAESVKELEKQEMDSAFSA